MTLLTNAIVVLLAKVTLVLCLGITTVALARHKGPAVRHAVWVITLVGTLLVPIIMVGIPAWRVGVLPPRHTVLSEHAPGARQTQAVVPTPSGAHATQLVSVDLGRAVSRTETTSSQPASTHSGSIFTWLFWVWLLGTAIGLTRLVIGHLGLRRLRCFAEPVQAATWQAMLLEERARAGVGRPVSLLASNAVSTPVTWGTWRPVILLPATARAWTGAQQRVALRHELAHIARGDTLTQFWAALARIVYWFHPIVRFAVYRLRLEGEQACDERVVLLGTPPTEYAGQLLELARSAHHIGMPTSISVAMARPSQLDQRLRAILFTDRHAFNRRGAIATGALVSLLVVSIAILQPVARESARHDRRPVSGLAVTQPTPSKRDHSAGALLRWNRVPLSAPRPADRTLGDGNIQVLPSDPCDSVGSISILISAGLTMRRINSRCTTTIRVKGLFKLTDDGKDIASLSPNGFVMVEDQYDSNVRKLKIVADPSGTLTRTWTINDSARPYDDEARKRLASALTSFKQDGSALVIGPTGGSQDDATQRQADALERQADALRQQADSIERVVVPPTP